MNKPLNLKKRGQKITKENLQFFEVHINVPDDDEKFLLVDLRVNIFSKISLPLPANDN